MQATDRGMAITTQRTVINRLCDAQADVPYNLVASLLRSLLLG
jgi:hypothetical protein